MLKVGVTPEVNAVSTLLLAVTVVLIVIAQRLQQPPGERGGDVLSGGRAAARGPAARGRRSPRGCGRGQRRAALRRARARRSSTSTSGRSTCRRRSSTSSRAAPGSRCNFDLYDSNEAVLEKLQSGVADYDLVVPSDYMVRILIHLKLLRPLDQARLKNLGNLDPRFLDKEFDPKNALLAALRLGHHRATATTRRRGRAARQLGAALRSGEQGPDPDARRHARVLRGRP